MVPTYRVTADADQDIADIERYVASYRGADFAIELSDRFTSFFRTLCRHPLQHPIYPFDSQSHLRHEYRSANLYHYKVFYWVDGDVTVIYRVLHQISDFTRARW